VAKSSKSLQTTFRTTLRYPNVLRTRMLLRSAAEQLSRYFHLRSLLSYTLLLSPPVLP